MIKLASSSPFRTLPSSFASHNYESYPNTDREIKLRLPYLPYRTMDWYSFAKSFLIGGIPEGLYLTHLSFFPIISPHSEDVQRRSSKCRDLEWLSDHPIIADSEGSTTLCTRTHSQKTEFITCRHQLSPHAPSPTHTASPF
jgi:hypothetical protein